MKLFAITLVLLLLCVAAAGIRIWLKGCFTETEIGRNKNMRKLGINCVRDEEMKLHSKNTGNSGCGTCALLSKCDRARN
ncbi:MAG: hypothetical protein LBG92_11580 [Prevotellaceae bacterium]|jgi:hypothetical protein|nr:hypothetical protein [Prevotellaceae bacterium]